MVSLGLVTHDHLEGERRFDPPSGAEAAASVSAVRLCCFLIHRDPEQEAGEEEEDDGQPGVQRRRLRARGTSTGTDLHTEGGAAVRYWLPWLQFLQFLYNLMF